MLHRLTEWLFPGPRATMSAAGVERNLEAGLSGLDDKAGDEAFVEEKVEHDDEKLTALTLTPHLPAIPPHLILIYRDADIEVWAEQPPTPPPSLSRSPSSASASHDPPPRPAPPPPKPHRLWALPWIRVLLLFVAVSFSWVGLVAMGLWNSMV